MTDAIVFRQVGKHFGRDASRPAIADLSFAIARGEHVSIVGRTGCGKSTTVNLILGLAAATRGDVRVLGVDPHRDFASLRGRVGCVFQGDRLLPWRTALDNVLVPLEVLGRRKGAEASAIDLLASVGLGGHEQAFPHQLSGGMRQRVALARALITRPEIMIADEAFGHLDEVTAAALRRDFKALAADANQTVVQITHSLDEALAVSDRVLVFDRPGRLIGSCARSEWADGQRYAYVKECLRALIAGGAPADELRAA